MGFSDFLSRPKRNIDKLRLSMYKKELAGKKKKLAEAKKWASRKAELDSVERQLKRYEPKKSRRSANSSYLSAFMQNAREVSVIGSSSKRRKRDNGLFGGL